MSRRDVVRLREARDAWNRGEFDLSMLDPEVVFEETVLPDNEGETYRGHEGVLRAWARWAEAWEEFTTGGRADHRCRGAARLDPHGVPPGQALRVSMMLRYAYLYTLRDGKVIHLRSYVNPAEALEAAGLRE